MFKTIGKYKFHMPGPGLGCAEVETNPCFAGGNSELKCLRTVGMRFDLDLEKVAKFKRITEKN